MNSLQQIDFLPKRYHEEKVRRSSNLWRLLLVVLFGGICALAAVGQNMLRRSVARRLDEVVPQHAAATASTELYGRLQVELREIEDEAELYAFLKHPWPRSQLLNAVSASMPEAVRLHRLNITQEAVQGDPSAFRSTDAAKQHALLKPARRDLVKLDSNIKNRRTIIELLGETSDDSRLHAFIGQLAEHPLFQTAELVSLESTGPSDPQGRSTFKVRVVVRPPHGQQPRPTATAAPKLQSERPVNGDA